jgi:transposase
LRNKPSAPTRRIGEKNGSKRHLLVDGRGVPLSLIVTAASVNDGQRLDEVLSASQIKYKNQPHRRQKHLCADAGYRSAENLRIIEAHGYIAHVVDRRREALAKNAIRRIKPSVGW